MGCGTWDSGRGINGGRLNVVVVLKTIHQVNDELGHVESVERGGEQGVHAFLDKRNAKSLTRARQQATRPMKPK